MVAKLSSVRIITAASLETSVPVMPMATPMSAFLRAGASLTPSPVMATMLDCAWSVPTRRILSSGETRATTPMSSSSAISCSSLMAANSVPVSALPGMPSSRPMAAAVTAWSPVIMRTSMPARWHCSIAAFASARGGSTMPTIAKSVRSRMSSRCGASGWNVAGSKSRRATTMTRSPLAAMRSFSSLASCRRSSSIGVEVPSGVQNEAARPSNTSGAPLTKQRMTSLPWWSVIRWNVAMNL